MAKIINVSKSILTDFSGDELRLYLAFRFTEETIRHKRDVSYGAATLQSSHDIVSHLTLSDASKQLKGATDACLKKAEQGLLSKGAILLVDIRGEGVSEHIYLLGYVLGVHYQYLIYQNAIECGWPLSTTPIVVRRNRYYWGERLNEAIPIEVIQRAIQRQKARQFKGTLFQLGVPEEKKKPKIKPMLKPKDRALLQKRQRAYHDFQLHQGPYEFVETEATFTVLPYYDIYFDESLKPDDWRVALDTEMRRMEECQKTS